MKHNSSNATKPYIDYYSSNNISPVSQDISDLEQHYCRRNALYRFLGIPSMAVRGRDVLELGPGSGYNALHTASLKPKSYVLVDGNATGLDEAKRLLTSHNILDVTYRHSLIEDYEDNKQYDLVLGEGFLSFQEFPVPFLKKIMSFVAPGGILVTTSQDSISSVSDLLRRAIGQYLTDRGIQIKEQALRLVPIFEPHFCNLLGMSRPIYDWILDNVLQPFYYKYLFSFSDCLREVSEDFIFLGSSPHFVIDWAWYKQCLDNKRPNSIAQEAFQRNRHNFLDFRFVYPERDTSENMELEQLADSLSDACITVKSESDLSRIREIVILMAENIEKIGSVAAETTQALRDAANGFKHLAEQREKTDFASFMKLFGRGQQYISFSRLG